MPKHRSEADAGSRDRVEREEVIIAKGEAALDTCLGARYEKPETWLDLPGRDPDARIPLPSISQTAQ